MRTTPCRWVLPLLVLWVGRAEAQGAAPGPDEVAEEQIQAVARQYGVARRVFGDSHVMLTAVLYGASDRRESEGNGKLRTGAAGLISVPLLGVGGGHGVQGFPRLQTDDESAVLMDFDRRISGYYDVLKRREVRPRDDAEAEERFDRRVRLFDSLLEAEGQRSVARETSGTEGCPTDWVFRRPERLRDCLALLRASTAPVAVRLEQLDALWREYLRLKGTRAAGRHNLLVGPALGLSLNDEAISMWGILAEVGATVLGKPVRFAVSGGILRPRNDPFDVSSRPDWWIGLGLSGQFGDDLFNGFRSAYSARFAQP
jgi:hypothetical protein